MLVVLFFFLFYSLISLCLCHKGQKSDLGYHLIFTPPTFDHATLQPMSYAHLTGRIDVATLLAEWIGVAAISFLVWKFLARTQDT